MTRDITSHAPGERPLGDGEEDFTAKLRRLSVGGTLSNEIEQTWGYELLMWSVIIIFFASFALASSTRWPHFARTPGATANVATGCQLSPHRVHRQPGAIA